MDVDSLAYLSLENLKAAIDAPGAGFCDACLTGHYPVPVPVGDRVRRRTQDPVASDGSLQPVLPGV